MNYSRQREQIFQYIKNSKTHPTAEEIYNNLRKTNPNISLGTVYRNLDVLFNAGFVNRIISSFGKDRYDAVLEGHCHAECIKCGRLQNIFIDSLPEVSEEVEKQAECKVLSHNLVFESICKRCEECCRKVKKPECKKCKEGDV